MLRGRAAGTRARKCAYQRDAQDRSAGVAKTGGVPSGPGFADRRGRGQDSSMSTVSGRDGSASAVLARGRAKHGAARAARRLCPALRQERPRFGGPFCWQPGRYPALRACGVAAELAFHDEARGLPVADFAADRFAARVGVHARAGLCAPGLRVLGPHASGHVRWWTQRETPPVGGRQRHCSLRA